MPERNKLLGGTSPLPLHLNPYVRKLPKIVMRDWGDYFLYEWKKPELPKCIPEKIRLHSRGL